MTTTVATMIVAAAVFAVADDEELGCLDLRFSFK
jgi:hypothetical protein